MTREQMREVDRIMVEDLGISVLQMMENAGRALARVAAAALGGSPQGRRVLILAGNGGNGGGAMAAARRLAGWGADLRVVTTDAPERMDGAAGHQARTLRALEIPMRASIAADERAADVVLDGMIGYSLGGPPRGRARDLIDEVGTMGIPVIALDIPSGLDVDTGEAPGVALTATATLTLAAPKVGFLVSAAAPFVGELLLADIGVPPGVLRRVGCEASSGPCRRLAQHLGGRARGSDRALGQRKQ
ncbi:MAG: NAD(P)H-hydrate epimerase [Intrasporangiaceae bacterium]|nr:NAD(P)H-hydrate epimerase [Intrasporangiaceae bacterium]